MNVNLDEIYQRVEPWEFTLTIDGKQLRVRRLDNADMVAMGRLGDMKQDEAEKFVAGLFEEADRPDVRGWDTAKAGLVVAAVAGYYEGQVKKKLAAAKVAAGGDPPPAGPVALPPIGSR